MSTRSSQASENAAEQFQEARARFAGQQPLIEIQKNDRALLHRETIPASAPRFETRRPARDRVRQSRRQARERFDSFWLLAHDAVEEFLVPQRHGIDFDSSAFHLNLEDLERRGPGLILDQADRRRIASARLE